MRILVSFLLTVGLFSNHVLANDSLIHDLDSSKQERIEFLLKRHKPAHVRPASCPMNSNNHKDILGKIKNIKDLFKDNCSNLDPARLDEILLSAESIQTEVDTATTSDAVQTPAVPTEINGQAISSVVNNINSILTTGQCKFKDGSFLENTADVISSFSQMGLLVPNSNGLLISAGGLALSSILRIIHNLFTPLFDFSKNTERQTFIKLNCAFYDIRRDIEASGFMDVPTEQHTTDLQEVKGIVKELDSRVKGMLKEKADIFKGLDKAEAEAVVQGLGALEALDKEVQKGLKIIADKVSDEAGIPANTKKLQVIQSLTLLRPSLLPNLQAYIDSGLSKIAVLDKLLVKELEKLDFAGVEESYMELINQDVNSFNNGFRASLLFHFDRIIKDIATSKASLVKKYNEETQVEGLSVAEYKKALDKKVADLLKTDGETLKKLKVIELRLARVTKDRDYTSVDDGEENIVAILSDYNEIAAQVYGEWGEKFLRYTTEESYKINHKFVSKFGEFSKTHLNYVDGKTIVPNVAEVSDLKVLYACQDAKPFRRTWRLGNSISQNGYDFLATNKDLFHSDTAESFMSGVHLRRSDFERIQHHYKSAMFAKRLIKGGEVKSSDRDKYLKKRGGHKRYLGMVMLDVNASKKKAALIQELIERFDCGKVTSEN